MYMRFMFVNHFLSSLLKAYLLTYQHFSVKLSELGGA